MTFNIERERATTPWCMVGKQVGRLIRRPKNSFAVSSPSQYKRNQKNGEVDAKANYLMISVRHPTMLLKLQRKFVDQAWSFDTTWKCLNFMRSSESISMTFYR